MTIKIIVAAAENNIIGKDNDMLWHLPRDMAFFKNSTWGLPVIMGRKTLESLGGPLKGRTNIVITRDQQQPALARWAAVVNGEGPKTLLAGSLEEALELARHTDSREAFVIGGGEIYRQALPLTDEILLTRVHARVEGDTSFPPIDEKKFGLSGSRSFDPDEKHQFGYTFETWRKR